MELMTKQDAALSLPKGYKQTEVGVIPEDWEVKDLSSLIDENRHIRYGVVQPGKYIANGCLMLRSQDYSKGWTSADKMHRVNSVIEQQYQGTKLKTGDLVITIVGAGIAQVVEVPRWIEGTLLSRSTARIAIQNDKACSKFVHFYLSSSDGKAQILFGIKEGAQPVVSAIDVGNCKIPLPPTLTEQKAIATALSDVDALISSLDQLITKKKAIKQGAMQELLTGKTRLQGFAGSGRFKQTEVGVIPEEWEVVEVSDVFDFSGGSQPPRSTFIFNEKKGYIRLLQIRDYKSDKYQTYIPESLAQKKCSKDDIMIGRYGPPIFQILKGLEGAYNVALIKAIPKNISKLYGYYFLTQNVLFEFIEKLSQRSSGQTGVDLKQLKQYKFPLPPTLTEQKAIANVLSDMDQAIERLESKKAKYQGIKQGMMQELLTGKTRLI